MPYYLVPEDFYNPLMFRRSNTISFFPDRSSWSEKSKSAIARENEAKRLFDDFYSESASLQTTAFPVMKEVIGPEIHLTAKCYQSFRQYVTSKGCQASRREISETEKMRLPRTSIRRFKQYAVSVTIPIHPEQRQAKEQKMDQMLAESIKALAEKSKKVQEEKKWDDRADQELVTLKNGTHPVLLGKRSSAAVTTFVTGSHDDKENSAPVSKKQNMSTDGPFSVPTSVLLRRLSEDKARRKSEIRSDISKERLEHITYLQKKQNNLEDVVEKDCSRLQAIIDGAEVDEQSK